jgi:hypothetical protein
MKKILPLLGGFVLGAVAGMMFALTFGQSLFGWHDNVGPEIRFAFFSGLAGACIGLIRRVGHEERPRAAHTEDRDE